MTQTELNEQQLAELAEILEIAKITEQKARELNELAIDFEAKWKRRLEDRRNKKQQASQSS
jgi:Asp-tRNA(Asn)/Glu-tRNA(Gln) amidotransferase B subunit